MNRQFSRMIQAINSMLALITVSWVLKEMHVASFPYLALEAPLTMTISMLSVPRIHFVALGPGSQNIEYVGTSMLHVPPQNKLSSLTCLPKLSRRFTYSLNPPRLPNSHPVHHSSCILYWFPRKLLGRRHEEPHNICRVPSF